MVQLFTILPQDCQNIYQHAFGPTTETASSPIVLLTGAWDLPSATSPTLSHGITTLSVASFAA